MFAPFSTALSAALDLLYPPGCAACDDAVDDDAFCRPCAETLVELGTLSPALMPPGLDDVRAPFAYGGAVADALRHLKFGGRTDLGEVLGRLLRPSLRSLMETLAHPIVVPIPLSMQRLAARGYNQAALLALAATPRICAERLRRTRDTAPQVGLSAAARRAAMNGAFAAPAGAFSGRDVVLVDDVLTTGATLSAAALAARAAGAGRVVGLTVARALS